MSTSTPSQPIRVSASRLKTLWQCTLIFYYQEILHIPSGVHIKTRQGTVTHRIFEHLLAPKRRARLRSIIMDGFLATPHEDIVRYIRIYDAKESFSPYQMTDMLAMLEVAFIGIRPYFINAANEWSPPDGIFTERKFYLKLGEATISGIIDLLLTWMDGREVISDIKTQGAKFTKADVPHNLQAIIYQMARARETGKPPPPVEFILVRHAPSPRFPRNHIQRVEPHGEHTLAGLEYYLEESYRRVNQFTYEDALSNTCADLGWCQRVCGYYKPFAYWVIYPDTDPQHLAAALSSHLSLDKATSIVQNGQHIVEKRHEGCMVRWRGGE